MGKVFRFHQDNLGEDWFSSSQYGQNAIDGIQDPAGDTPNHEITSIPSPFARIDLVKTAFKYVVDKNDLNGNTTYHKLISDCLDVGEILFNIDKFPNKLAIIPWDQNTHLNNLLNSNNARLRRYGESLRLFLTQDSQEYNFDQLDRLYIILYDHQVIGGTSPVTLFFPSANDLSFVDVRFGNHEVFDQDPTPLYNREPEFQKYLYSLRQQIANFSNKFKSLNDYLEINLNNELFNRNHTLYQEINNITENHFNQLEDLTIPGQAGNVVEVLGDTLKRKPPTPIQSDFEINSQKYQQTPKPLVLQNNFTRRLKYTFDYWDSNIKVPYEDKRPLNQRMLPGLGDQYPYITVSDFLEPYLIKLIYPINKDCFFNNNDGGDSFSYLTPVKPFFFNFFEPEYLTKKIDGNNVFELESVAGGAVKATLRVPIQDGFITLDRIYYKSEQNNHIAKPEPSNNKGVITENGFSINIFPFIKTDRAHNSHYRVFLIDNDTKDNEYSLNFYDADNNKLGPKTKSIRSKKNDAPVSTLFYVLESEFSYLQIQNQFFQATIIPKFPSYEEGNDEFTFALDFGTTNSHIEYSVNGGPPKPFEVTNEDQQIATLFDPAIQKIEKGPELLEWIPHEFLPKMIGNDYEYQFPLRTTLSEAKGLNLQQATYTLADVNIPFIYEKERLKRNASIKTNLKWSNYPEYDEEEIRVRHFFENLIFLIRNKVILNRGDLNQTKLLWFYPSSMIPARIDKLNQLLKDLVVSYISPQLEPIGLPESIAPFYYYKSYLQVDASDKPVVAIDIGGGTSDIAVYEGNEPKLLTSVRFGTESIFGDAYGGSPGNNGFVNKYREKIKKLFQENNFKDLEAVLEEIGNNGNSQDIIDFFFSIESNKKVIEKNAPISFSKMLSEDRHLKLVILLFYAGLIYHIAKLLKTNDSQMPRFVTFSGTGSKVLDTLDNSNNYKRLTGITKLIFNKVYSNDEPFSLDLSKYQEPKEITCKGGILGYKEISNINIENIKTVLIHDNKNNDSEITYAEIGSESKTLQQVCSEVEEFIDLFNSVNLEYSFKDNFNIDPAIIGKYEDELKNDIMTYLKTGLNKKKQEIGDQTNTKVEETPFFYALIGILNKLAYKLTSTEEKSE